MRERCYYKRYKLPGISGYAAARRSTSISSSSSTCSSALQKQSSPPIAFSGGAILIASHARQTRDRANTAYFCAAPSCLARQDGTLI
jgi:hypothetical protein